MGDGVGDATANPRDKMEAIPRRRMQSKRGVHSLVIPLSRIYSTGERLTPLHIFKYGEKMLLLPCRRRGRTLESWRYWMYRWRRPGRIAAKSRMPVPMPLPSKQPTSASMVSPSLARLPLSLGERPDSRDNSQDQSEAFVDACENTISSRSQNGLQ